MKIAVVGATGLVGKIMLQVLEEENIPVSEIIPVASSKSVGKFVDFKGKQVVVQSITDAIAAKPAIALFSAGGETSLKWASEFAKHGTFVIDNSSAWRMNEAVPLVVPEINPGTININTKIIANPNCSTIQMVVPLSILHKNFSIKRIVVSTYQAVSGSGVRAVNQLEGEEACLPVINMYPHQIHRNVIPQCDVFLDNNYTKEEMKMVNETHKILNDNAIAVTATAVRVPIVAGHSESVNLEFNKPFEIEEIFELLGKQAGVVIVDDPKNSKYPMPIEAVGKNEIFVGRIRRDFSVPNGLNLWIVADNLRKGAATNAVQIAKYLIEQKLV